MTGLDWLMFSTLFIGIIVILGGLVAYVCITAYCWMADTLDKRKRKKHSYVVHYRTADEYYDVFYDYTEEGAIKQFKKKMGSVAYSILDIIER